jgi:hypothetical protein
MHLLLQAHSDQISRLTEIVESLQSQIKLIGQKRTSGNNKTSSIQKIEAPQIEFNTKYQIPDFNPYNFE